MAVFLSVRRVLGRRSDVDARHRGRSLFGEGPPAPDADRDDGVALDLRADEPVIELGGAESSDVEVAPALPPQPNLRAPGEMWHPTVQRSRSGSGSLSAFGLPYPAEDRMSWRDLRDDGADARRSLAAGSEAVSSTRVAWDRLVDGTAPRARYGLGPAVDLYAASEQRLAELQADQRRGARSHLPHAPRLGGLFGSAAPGEPDGTDGGERHDPEP